MFKNTLKELFSLNEDELKKTIENKKKHLEENSLYKNNMNLSKIHDGYIPEKINIEISDTSLLSYNLVGIDYFEYINFLKNQNVDINNLSHILTTTGIYVSNFFNYNPLKKYEELREKCIIKEYQKKGLTNYLDIFDSKYVPSINIFKGNGHGVCLEHSLLMQNLLSFIGVDTTMVTMYGKRDDNIFGHAVNFINFDINGETRHLYYDLVSMEVLYDEDNNLKTIPTIKVISDEKYKKFLNEEEMLEITRRNVTENNKIQTSVYYVKSIKTMNKIKNLTNKKNGV